MQRKSFPFLDMLVLVLAMVFPTVLTYVYFVYLAASPSGAQQIAYGIGKTLQFALPVLWIGVVCRQRCLVRRLNNNGLLEGFIFGFLVFWAMLLLYLHWFGAPGGPLDFGTPARTAVFNKIHGLGVSDWRLFLLLGTFYSIIHSGLEEYYWRWFVFGTLRKYLHWIDAALISSLGFMAHHVILLGTYFGYDSPYCWLGSLGVAVGGFYWACLYYRSDSIWGPWFGHGLVDAAIFTIGFLIMNEMPGAIPAVKI